MHHANVLWAQWCRATSCTSSTGLAGRYWQGERASRKVTWGEVCPHVVVVPAGEQVEADEANDVATVIDLHRAIGTASEAMFLHLLACLPASKACGKADVTAVSMHTGNIKVAIKLGWRGKAAWHRCCREITQVTTNTARRVHEAAYVHVHRLDPTSGTTHAGGNAQVL